MEKPTVIYNLLLNDATENPMMHHISEPAGKIRTALFIGHTKNSGGTHRHKAKVLTLPESIFDTM